MANENEIAVLETALKNRTSEYYEALSANQKLLKELDALRLAYSVLLANYKALTGEPITLKED